VFGDYRLSALTPSLVDEYIRDERDRERALEGINRDIRLLKAIVNYAVSRKKITANPIASVKSSARMLEKRPRVLSASEEQALFAQFTGKRAKLQPLVAVALNTGLRRSELFSLEWKDIDFKERVLTVRPETSKGKKYRTIPINEDCFQVLKWLYISSAM